MCQLANDTRKNAIRANDIITHVIRENDKKTNVIRKISLDQGLRKF